MCYVYVMFIIVELCKHFYKKIFVKKIRPILSTEANSVIITTNNMWFKKYFGFHSTS